MSTEYSNIYGNTTDDTFSTTFTGTPDFTGTDNVVGLTKTHVGLGNVTNESKATMFTDATFTGSTLAGTQTFDGKVTIDETKTSNTSVTTSLSVNGTYTMDDNPLSNNENWFDHIVFEPDSFTASTGAALSRYAGVRISKPTSETWNNATVAKTALLKVGVNISRAGVGNDWSIESSGTNYLKTIDTTSITATTIAGNPVFSGTPTGLTGALIGLENVTNESKATMFTDATFTGAGFLYAPVDLVASNPYEVPFRVKGTYIMDDNSDDYFYGSMFRPDNFTVNANVAIDGYRTTQISRPLAYTFNTGSTCTTTSLLVVGTPMTTVKTPAGCTNWGINSVGPNNLNDITVTAVTGVPMERAWAIWSYDGAFANKTQSNLTVTYDSATGKFLCTFGTDPPDTNYRISVHGSFEDDGNLVNILSFNIYARLTTSFKLHQATKGANAYVSSNHHTNDTGFTSVSVVW